MTHKDAIAACGGEVSCGVCGQAKSLLHDCDGRRANAECVQADMPGHCPKTVVYRKSIISGLREQEHSKDMDFKAQPCPQLL